MKLQPFANPKRRFRLGPGTVIALVAALGIGIYGQIGDRRAQAPGVGKTVYEADAAGRMQRLDAPPTSSAKPPPLWKPEVGLLLQHASELQIDGPGMQRIEALDTAWKWEKAGMEEALRNAVSTAAGKRQEAQGVHSASALQITGSLSDYSRLSHQYNAQRTIYWQNALATLTTKQKSLLEGITEKDRKGRSL